MTTELDFPDHTDLLSPQIIDIIGRCFFQVAKSVDHIPGGQHAYCVRNWAKDDVSADEFDLVAQAIKAHGRREEFIPPIGFFDSGNRKPQRGEYLYVRDAAGELYSYWFTWPRGRVSMLNRELRSRQLAHPTRRPLGAKTTTQEEADHVGTQLKLTD
jgi:hypothetical protein